MAKRGVQAELEDLRERVGELEAELANLREQVRIAGGDLGTDQYDGAVLRRLEADREYTKRQIGQLYRQAGIRDGDKIRRRVRDLENLGILERIGGNLRLADAGEGEQAPLEEFSG